VELGSVQIFHNLWGLWKLCSVRRTALPRLH